MNETDPFVEARRLSSSRFRAALYNGLLDKRADHRARAVQNITNVTKTWAKAAYPFIVDEGESEYDAGSQHADIAIADDVAEPRKEPTSNLLESFSSQSIQDPHNEKSQGTSCEKTHRSEQNEVEDDDTAEAKLVLHLHLLTALRHMITAPFTDVQVGLSDLLSRLSSWGVPVPVPIHDSPSLFIPLEKLAVMTDETEGEEEDEIVGSSISSSPSSVHISPSARKNIFVHTYLTNSRVSHVYHVMAYFPSYLALYQDVYNRLVKDTSSSSAMGGGGKRGLNRDPPGGGPLPRKWKFYLGLMAASQYKCYYVASLLKLEYLAVGGDPQWLEGLQYAPPKLQNIASLNAILAHQPWRLRVEDICSLVKGTGNVGAPASPTKTAPDTPGSAPPTPTSTQTPTTPYSSHYTMAELVQAIAILATFHSLSSFSLGAGISVEVDAVGGAKTPPMHRNCKKGNDSVTKGPIEEHTGERETREDLISKRPPLPESDLEETAIARTPPLSVASQTAISPSDTSPTKAKPIPIPTGNPSNRPHAKRKAARTESWKDDATDLNTSQLIYRLKKRFTSLFSSQTPNPLSPTSGTPTFPPSFSPNPFALGLATAGGGHGSPDGLFLSEPHDGYQNEEEPLKQRMEKFERCAEIDNDVPALSSDAMETSAISEETACATASDVTNELVLGNNKIPPSPDHMNTPSQNDTSQQFLKYLWPDLSWTSPEIASSASSTSPVVRCHEDFDVHSDQYSVFRLQEFCWEDHAQPMVSKFLPGVGEGLDEVFRETLRITDCTLAHTKEDSKDDPPLDTWPFRQAVHYYVLRLAGIVHDDYNYADVNNFLNRKIKSYIKKVVCYPEVITYEDFASLGIRLREDERIHILIIASEAKRQAELVYGLSAVMKFAETKKQ